MHGQDIFNPNPGLHQLAWTKCAVHFNHPSALAAQPLTCVAHGYVVPWIGMNGKSKLPSFGQHNNHKHRTPQPKQRVNQPRIAKIKVVLLRLQVSLFKPAKNDSYTLVTLIELL